MKRTLLAVTASVGLLAGCDGFKEALTAHVDIVARAGSQELSVDRLAELLGTSQTVPLSDDAARKVADVWVNYQLLAQAAARGDSLKDPKLIESAMWPMIAQQRTNKWYETVSKTWSVDTTASESAYNRGDVLAAQHILFATSEQGLTQAKKDSIRRVAESVRAQVTAANFADLAKRHSTDPGSKDKGGIYPAFPRGTMVKEFEQSVTSLKPGEIAPGIVTTNFGYHIIRRPTYAEVKDDFARGNAEHAQQAAESTYFARVESAGNIKFKGDAAATIRKVIQSPDEFRDDNTVIATSAAGDFTAKRFAQWLNAYPEQQRMQMRRQVAQVPDSILVTFTRRQFLRNELVLRQADSAKVALTPAEMADLRNQFGQLVQGIWGALGIAPSTLADSGKTPAERQRVAATHIEQYMDKLLTDQAQYIDVPMPLQEVLRSKYEYKVNKAGIGRALERAAKVRSAADSARAAQRPQSQVPLGGAPGAPAVPGTQSRPQPPQPAAPSKQP
jgi:hypothetical protein